MISRPHKFITTDNSNTSCDGCWGWVDDWRHMAFEVSIQAHDNRCPACGSEVRIGLQSLGIYAHVKGLSYQSRTNVEKGYCPAAGYTLAQARRMAWDEEETMV